MAEPLRVPAPSDSDPLAWLTELDGVPSGLQAARDGIDAMLRDRGLRKTSPDQTGESLLRGAHASAVLEGSASTLEEIREGAGDEIALAALRVNTGALALVPVINASPLQAFARLHALAGKGDIDEDALGRPVSPAGADRLSSLADTLVATTVPALMVGALVHAELATVAPFASHNGLVARAAERLVLVARGVDPASVVVPEAGHLALRATYESNLRGYRDGGRNGLHSWLLYAGEAITKGVEASPLRD
ncbi:oxidoreductase [Nocardioides marmoriginsengisoli]|uniref:Oxidoreductase n=1 Tax=Nocardioides marmoriginsengisoli TaxID=661483 RepID=A0A3N0CFE8_9ACTN|nr:oxidoreductase [Nocardioides marmoriginsengisoli]RNL62184.1 oxidoreductase [Nocardioides marmoriginsengisoli]